MRDTISPCGGMRRANFNRVFALARKCLGDRHAWADRSVDRRCHGGHAGAAPLERQERFEGSANARERSRALVANRRSQNHRALPARTRGDQRCNRTADRKGRGGTTQAEQHQTRVGVASAGSTSRVRARHVLRRRGLSWLLPHACGNVCVGLSRLHGQAPQGSSWPVEAGLGQPIIRPLPKGIGRTSRAWHAESGAVMARRDLACRGMERRGKVVTHRRAVTRGGGLCPGKGRCGKASLGSACRGKVVTHRRAETRGGGLRLGPFRRVQASLGVASLLLDGLPALSPNGASAALR